jgi:hypothetical protein
VAALLASEARPGDTTFDFSTPTLSVKLSLPPPTSITAEALAAVDQGSLQQARMVRSPHSLKYHPNTLLACGTGGGWTHHVPF